jgi:dTDP-4-dehydrorhamnose reductase
MTILLFGKNGQVGRELQRTLLPHGELIALGREEADLADPETVSQALHEYNPQIVVNAAAYTAVDKAEQEEEIAQRINGESVEAMARYAKAAGALLVHYSTDYVFDGEKEGAYAPQDKPNPQSAYGRTKLAGENTITESGCSHLIFRTSWVYSAIGHNFIKTMLRLASEKAALKVVADQRGAPTSAELIADVTSLSIAAYRQDMLKTGVYHLVASGQTTWHGLASYAIDRATAMGWKLNLSSNQIQPIPTSEFPTPAKRPANSILDTSTLERPLNLALPDWRQHVDRMLNQLANREIAP